MKYSFTLDALSLKPFDFCNGVIGNYWCTLHSASVKTVSGLIVEGSAFCDEGFETTSQHF